jgi:hypothetical protein
MPAPKAYASPFDPTPDDCSRTAKMLRRCEKGPRERLEAEEVPIRVAKWVAGGHTREERARRADVAIYLRARRQRESEREGWPELWQLVHFAKVDADHCASRRARGLARPTVAQGCDQEAIPREAPPPTRRTARQRRDEDLREVVEAQARLAGELARLGSLAEQIVKGDSKPELARTGAFGEQRKRA